MHNTGCTVDRKALLIFYNQKAHVSLAAVGKTKANGVVLLTIPLHTSHNLQSLDVAVYGPYKKAYARAMGTWMNLNSGRIVSFYDIPEIVNEAQLSACIPRNVLDGIQSIGILPFSRRIFSDIDYAPAAVANKEYD